MTTKDEIKNRISMTLKDPILQQGFEIICKNLAELEKACDETQELLDKQIEATFKLVKENAELKETVIKMNNIITETFGNLTEAKAIIKDYMIVADHTTVCSVPEENRCINVLKLNEQAEQFLNRQGDNEND